MASKSGDVLPISPDDDEEFTMPNLDKGLVYGAMEVESYKNVNQLDFTPTDIGVYIHGERRGKEKDVDTNKEKNSCPAKWRYPGNDGDVNLVDMDSEATLIVSPIRSNPPCTISNLLCPPLVRLSRKVIKVTNSRLGTDNEETIHTLLGSIILPTDRKMYEKETTAELNHLSKVLTYEFIILKEMRHLKIVGASTMLGKQDEDINKLNKQVENFMVSKKGLEKEVTSLRSQVGELTSSLQREKRDQADKALLIHVKISQLKEVLQKTRVESKANFD